MKIRMKLLLTVLGLALLLSGCSSGEKAETSGALTTTARTTISIYLDDSNSFMFDYMKSVIENFPQYKFNVTYLPSNYEKNELEREILNRDTGDIIISANLSPDMAGVETGLADLSAKDYCARYKPSYLKDVDLNGRIYFLPMASVVEGIVYNKTLFDENGWTLPKNYDEYQALCKTILAAGYGVEGKPLSGIHAGTLFQRCYMLDSGWRLSSYHWLNQFNQREASIRDIDWKNILNDLDTSAEIRRESTEYLKEKSGIITASVELSSRSYAMMESSTSLLGQMTQAGDSDQFRLMPFFGSSSDGGYLLSSGTVKFGASAKAMADPAKAEAIDALFSYFSSEKGQNDINAYTFNVIAPTEGGTPQTGGDFFADVQTELSEGRILSYDTLTNCYNVLDDCVTAYVNGAMTRTQLLNTLDRINRNGNGEDRVLAAATDTFSLDNMSGLLLDAVREEAGTDFSLLYRNITDIHIGNIPIARRYLMSVFYKGPITALDLSCCIQGTHYEDYDPGYQPTSLVRYTMTGRQILNLLEYGKDIYLGGGLTMIYTWDADKNTYFASGFTADNGKAFDLNAEYTVASLSNIPIEENACQSREDTGIAYYAAIRDWLSAKGTVSPAPLPEAVMKGKP